MKVQEVMTHSVVVIDPDSTLVGAAKKMQELDIGVLPVIENSRLVGMLTDRDITVRSIGARHDPRHYKVGDAMTPETIFCFLSPSPKVLPLLSLN